ncbi:hypothetical protein J0A68_18995 [Algoriphagus sp. H41]|uniref:Por secretion system C-terminal sorting domain-containing protein n=1 Tax=Algoriphagus oliviformis TaxID=2811231 RepID=A0ABS3C7F1_9BACT|nr:hypothetical protein [Algoriphagus oliviformis]MBN7813049.1 hypothetical protein [Algoriphagus oliviformis]
MKVYPTASSTISSDSRSCGGLCFESTVKNRANAVGAEDANYARLYSSPGILGYAGAYQAEIELSFASNLAANTWSYVRIQGDSDLFEALLGGSLGNLIGGILGSVLLGRQEIRVQALNSAGTAVLSRRSTEGFNTDRVRLVMDKNGHYYLAIRPSQAYNRIRIRNFSVAGVGLGAEYTLDVYHAFYFGTEDRCTDRPTFTSFDGSGATLDLLTLNQQSAGLYKAIDEPTTTYSEISLGVVGLNGQVEQMVFFNTPIAPGNDILVSMSKDASLVDLSLLNHVELVAYAEDVEIKALELSSLLDLDLLGLFSSGQVFQFPISSETLSIDRIGIRVSSLLAVGVLEGKLLVNSVTVAPSPPTIDPVWEEDSFVVCEGNTVTITPQALAGRVLHWYHDREGADYIGEAASYAIPDDLVPGEYDYFVRTALESCAAESLPSSFTVKVIARTLPDDFEVESSEELPRDEHGNYRYKEGPDPVVLTPVADAAVGDGYFEWYFDTDMQDTIYHGSVRDEVVYEVGADGVLRISGLPYSEEANPLRYYLNWNPADGCASRQPKQVDLVAQLRILPITLRGFTAGKFGAEQVRLTWQLAANANIERVKVMRAGLDMCFVELASLTAEAHSPGEFLDQKPLAGSNYYRLELQSEAGEVVFVSALQLVEVAFAEEAAFRVFPNHFENRLHLAYTKKERVEAEVLLYSGRGSLLRRERVAFAGSQREFSMEGLHGLPTGNYVLQIATKETAVSLHLVKK